MGNIHKFFIFKYFYFILLFDLFLKRAKLNDPGPLYNRFCLEKNEFLYISPLLTVLNTHEAASLHSYSYPHLRANGRNSFHLLIKSRVHYESRQKRKRKFLRPVKEIS